MYKRLTVAQLKKLCDDRVIDSACVRFKREFVTALEQFDTLNNNAHDDVDDRLGASAVATQGELASDDEDIDDDHDGDRSDVEQSEVNHTANDSPITQREMVYRSSRYFATTIAGSQRRTVGSMRN